MSRSAVALVGCLAAVVLLAGCRRAPAPVRRTATPNASPEQPKPPPRPAPKLRYKKPEAAGILAAGLVGAAPAGPLALACYADFVHDTAELLDLAPRYDRPVIAGLLGASLSGTAAAGPWPQLAYADVAGTSFDLLEVEPPAERPRVMHRSRRPAGALVATHPMYNVPAPRLIYVRLEDLDLRPLAAPGSPAGARPKGGAAKAKAKPAGGKVQ